MLLLRAYSQYRPGLLVNISTGELPLMKKNYPTSNVNHAKVGKP